MTDRKKYIDILKAIGLLCIILAHVTPPEPVMITRNFDVVLMILISAYLGISSTKKENYLAYVWKRFVRLVIPTWLFLLFFLPLAKKLELFKITPLVVKHTFALDNYNTIGYVWVIRIYLIVALLVPICKYLINKGKDKLLLIITLILYISYEIACHYNLFVNRNIEYAFAYWIPCLLLIVMSYYFLKADNKRLICYFIFFSLTCLGIGYYLYHKTGVFPLIQTMKYPFRLYYLSYGLAASALLIIIFKNDKVSNFVSNKVLEFISKHSLWIYLWHVLIIYLFKKVEMVWYLRYLIVVAGAISITLVQTLIVKLLDKIKTPKFLTNILNG